MAGDITPSRTRRAPTSTTATMPRFKSRLTMGLLAPVQMPARISSEATLPATAWKEADSYSVRESAFTTRMPA